MAIGTYISMTLNVNGLIAPRDTDWLHVHKNKTIYMLSTRNPLQTSRHILAESERMEKYIPCKCKGKKAQVTILRSNKIDLKIKNITRDKEGHYIMTEDQSKRKT